ncbi:hypothetical protein M422DRAFT_262035 [Sphaerobolus stellatus SS14]|uniref:Uncharacterized protein n=1 Tax=Sphaerobolus stellatus (strain SS14) TaxID=990650 RepID=A0A0C9TYU4_SPHS4|nr:hypothetical protein M422DRAFT_262035 [Sphaerobolus stellatus SS14]
MQDQLRYERLDYRVGIHLALAAATTLLDIPNTSPTRSTFAHCSTPTAVPDKFEKPPRNGFEASARAGWFKIGRCSYKELGIVSSER